jgi:tryptophan-rich sensory protein
VLLCYAEQISQISEGSGYKQIFRLDCSDTAPNRSRRRQPLDATATYLLCRRYDDDEGKQQGRYEYARQDITNKQQQNAKSGRAFSECAFDATGNESSLFVAIARAPELPSRSLSMEDTTRRNVDWPIHEGWGSFSTPSRYEHPPLDASDTNRIRDRTITNRILGKRQMIQKSQKRTRDAPTSMLESGWNMEILPVVVAVLPKVAHIVLATSRILLPMAAFQRVFIGFYSIAKDWYAGKYIRTTFEHMERQYHTRYQIPACFRSLGRTFGHFIALIVWGRAMEWLVGLNQTPCHIHGGGGCGGYHRLCSLLWIVATLGPGHTIGVAIAIWGGPLRVRVADQPRPAPRRLFFRRPWTLLLFLKDPDRWFREVLKRNRDDPMHALKPLDPDTMIFPAQWKILRAFQLLGLSREMHSSGEATRSLMRLVLLQQALGDEWFRVLMCEHRVALASVGMALYFLTTATIVVVMMQKPMQCTSAMSILAATASVLAAFLSLWRNVILYFDRRKEDLEANKDAKRVPRESLPHYERRMQDDMDLITRGNAMEGLGLDGYSALSRP